MQHLINLNQITKISIYYKEENKDIIYYSKPCTLRDLLLYVIGKFKPYCKLYDYKNYSLKEINDLLLNNNSYIENKIVYYYPYIKLDLFHGRYVIRYFNNVDELFRELEIIKQKTSYKIFYESTK
jgi:hypothetical protein